MFTKDKFTIMGSKSNISPVQVNDILDAHEDTLMKIYIIERLERKADNLTTENAVLKKWRIWNLQCSFILIQSTEGFLKLTQRFQKSTLLLMKISKLWLMTMKTCIKLEIYRIGAEGIILGLIGYRKHKEKTGMEIRPKLKSLSRKN